MRQESSLTFPNASGKLTRQRGKEGSPETSSACLASQLISTRLLWQSLLRYCWAFLLPPPECLSQFRKFAKAASAINNKSQSRNLSSRKLTRQLSRLMNISWQNDFCRSPSIFTPRERLKRSKNVKARAPHRAYKSRRLYQWYGESSAFMTQHLWILLVFVQFTGSGIEWIVFSNVLLRFMAQILIRTFTANIACDANVVNLVERKCFAAARPLRKFTLVEVQAYVRHFPRRYQVHCKLVAALRWATETNFLFYLRAVTLYECSI